MFLDIWKSVNLPKLTSILVNAQWWKHLYWSGTFSKCPETNCECVYHQATPLWIQNTKWHGHQYVLRLIQIRKSTKTDIIPCQYSVMEALELKWDILKLSRNQLRMCIPPSHSSVDPKLIMAWISVCSSTHPKKEIYQNWHHSLPILRDESTWIEVGHTQTVQKPIGNVYTTKPLLCGSKTQNDMDTSMFLDSSKSENLPKLTSFLANTLWWKHLNWSGIYSNCPETNCECVYHQATPLWILNS